MQDIGQSLTATFHQGRFSVGPIHGPLTLVTVESVDDVLEAKAYRGGPPAVDAGCQFWFDSRYLYHLLAMATDASADNAVEVAILERCLTQASAERLAHPPRVVRVRTAVLAHDQSVEAAVGEVAEQPRWVPRGGATGAPVARLQDAATQHLFRRRDIEPCLLARSLHWIELRPSRRRLQGPSSGA